MIIMHHMHYKICGMYPWDERERRLPPRRIGRQRIPICQVAPTKGIRFEAEPHQATI